MSMCELRSFRFHNLAKFVHGKVNDTSECLIETFFLKIQAEVESHWYRSMMEMECWTICMDVGLILVYIGISLVVCWVKGCLNL